MKVYLGKYPTFYSIYKVTDKLLFWMKDEKEKEALQDKIADSAVGELWTKFETKRNELVEKHRNYVKIDSHDYWNADSTMAHIILPILKRLQFDKQGAPQVDYDDVPEYLRPTEEEIAAYQKDGTTDDNFFKRWDWVMCEMIFAFESYFNDWEEQFSSGEIERITVPIDKDGNEVPEEEAEFFRWDKGPNDTYEIDMDGMKAYQDRISNGFRLFGKYYQSLWS